MWLKWITMGSGNSLPIQHQVITKTNVDLLSTRPLGTDNAKYSFGKISFTKCWPVSIWSLIGCYSNLQIAVRCSNPEIATLAMNIMRLRKKLANLPELKLIMLYDSHFMLMQISLKFLPKGAIKNKPVLVQKIAWCHTWGQANIWTSIALVYTYEHHSASMNELIRG